MNKNERCLWIVGTFIDYGDMSLRELNARFLDYTLNYEGEEIQPRTFDRDRRYIASTFQIDIDFDPRLKKYHLVNPEEIQDNPIFKYLLGSIHVNNLSTLALRHKDKIMLQEIPTGVELLQVMLNAIDLGRTVCFDYTSYYAKGKIFTYEVIPCFVRMFESRWYLICEYLDHSQTRVLALERMRRLSIGEKQATGGGGTESLSQPSGLHPIRPAPSLARGGGGYRLLHDLPVLPAAVVRPRTTFAMASGEP